MVNYTVGMALLVVLLIDGFLFAGQNIINDINPDNNIKFFSVGNDSIIGKQNIGTNGAYVLNTENVSQKFVGANPSVSGDTGDIFTDTFTAVKEWFFDSTGLNYVFAILGQPYYFCVAIGLPDYLSFMIGAVWYLFTLFLLILLVTGRSGG